MSSPIIDFHAHIFPSFSALPVSGVVPDSVRPLLSQARGKARRWFHSVTPTLHHAQTLMRHLPSPLRSSLDQLAGVVPVPGLIVESTAKDLLESMELHEVDQALVIAHPPMASNDFILEASRADERLIPVVNVPKEVSQPGAQLKAFVARGARALKIHPSADGEGADSQRYHTLLKAAAELGLPVILHTGCIHSHILYRKPAASRAELFRPWFKKYPETQFILAHMNFHEPNIAMDLALEFSNVFVDTSWQPAETIGEAVRRIGAERVLFGSDWPLLGDNLAVGIRRIRDCVQAQLITADDERKILGENAARILRIEGVETTHAG